MSWNVMEIRDYVTIRFVVWSGYANEVGVAYINVSVNAFRKGIWFSTC